MMYIQNSPKKCYEGLEYVLRFTECMQLSCCLLGTVLHLCDPIPRNLMKTLLYLTPYISRSVFEKYVLKSNMISSCYRGNVVF